MFLLNLLFQILSIYLYMLSPIYLSDASMCKIFCLTVIINVIIICEVEGDLVLVGHETENSRALDGAGAADLAAQDDVLKPRGVDGRARAGQAAHQAGRPEPGAGRGLVRAHRRVHHHPRDRGDVPGAGVLDGRARPG